MNIKVHKNKHWIVIVSVILLILFIGIGYWYLNRSSNNTKPSNKYYNPSTINPDSNVPKSDNQEGQSGSGITSSKDQSPTVAPTPDSSTTPSSPLGIFVSNHHPNLSGSPAPNTETSTCTTTPGVQCQIRFTQNNIVKYLPSQLTDANGNTNWNWKLQDINLTSGTWKVSAVATNGNKLSVANDSINLEVN
jgi:hypothetical protein